MLFERSRRIETCAALEWHPESQASRADFASLAPSPLTCARVETFGWRMTHSPKSHLTPLVCLKRMASSSTMFGLLIVAALVAGCGAVRPPCPIDLADAGCRPPSAQCADAGEGASCATFGVKCQQCVVSYHSYFLECSTTTDAGLRWSAARGIPPPGCPPE